MNDELTPEIINDYQPNDFHKFYNFQRECACGAPISPYANMTECFGCHSKSIIIGKSRRKRLSARGA